MKNIWLQGFIKWRLGANDIIGRTLRLGELGRKYGVGRNPIAPPL